MAELTHEEKAKIRELSASYVSAERKRKERILSSLTADEKAFLNPFLSNGNHVLADAFEKALEEGSTPSAYITEHMAWLFEKVIPPSHKPAVLYAVDAVKDYQYSTSYTRRSYRSESYRAYSERIFAVLRAYRDTVFDLPIARILNRDVPEDVRAYMHETPWDAGYCSWQVAYALDRGDKDAEDTVRRILTEENGMGVVTRELINGVFECHRREFHELMGKLLLAARLQEGLRQAICESADGGTMEAFLEIVRVIDENDLMRFSAVKRAVGTWLGLMSEETRDLERVSAKSLRIITECVCCEEKREEYLCGEDSMEIYIALWSYACHSIEKAAERVIRLAREGTNHQVLTAGYFARQTNFSALQTKMAKAVLDLHRDKADIVAIWLPCFMPDAIYSMLHKGNARITTWFDSREELDEFYTLMWLLYDEAPKVRTFSPCVFPWYEVNVAKSDFAERVCLIAAASDDDELKDDACSLLCECSADSRSTVFSALLGSPRTRTQRNTVLSTLADKSEYVRGRAMSVVSKMNITHEERVSIESHLRYKSADIRANVTSILMKQSDKNLSDCLTRLLCAKSEDMRLAALDMLTRLLAEPLRKYMVNDFTGMLSDMLEGATAKEKLLIEKLVPSEKKETEKKVLYTESDRYLPTEFDAGYIKKCADTFRGYFPDSSLPSAVLGEKKSFDILGGIMNAFGSKSESAKLAMADINDLSEYIYKYRTLTCTYMGEDALLGDNPYILRPFPNDKTPFSNLWDDWRTDRGVSNERLVRAFVLYHAYIDYERNKFTERVSGYISGVYGKGFETRENVPYSLHIRFVLEYLMEQVPKEELCMLGAVLAIWHLRCVSGDDTVIYGAHLLGHRQLLLIYNYLVCKNDDALKYNFPIAVATAERCVEAIANVPKQTQAENNIVHLIGGGEVYRSFYLYGERRYDNSKGFVGVKEYIYAAYRGVITKAQLYEFIFTRKYLSSAMTFISCSAAGFYEKDGPVCERNGYRDRKLRNIARDFLGQNSEGGKADDGLLDFATKLYEELVPTVIGAEISRGDSPTEYSHGVAGIYRVYGAEYLCGILHAMGKDTIDRNAYSGWGSVHSRRSSLSYLLSACVPYPNDDERTLAKALENRQISKKRLIEAALVAPEWIAIIGKYLGIPAFESVCYYFMAHMNESFDDKRRAMIARYTPLSEEELNMGAFDVEWFRAAHSSIGEKEFDMIYDAAKYITDGAKHSRARKYADASLGKFDVENTEKEISEKRNKDLLMAYSLIPLSGEDDICRRYLYIQSFRKQSKQFGAQRIASEAKASDMALKNLACNAGYADTMRLTLRMETKVIDDSRALLEPQDIDGVTLLLGIDETGKAEISVTKDGKALKSVPAKLKKHETVLALTALKKALTDQYRRTRVMLEQAMEDGTEFTFSELCALCAHPVVYPMLRNLVLISGEKTGFLRKEGLVDFRGEAVEMAPAAPVKIAHTYHLYSLGCWREYQSLLFEKGIVQPFRQVFRELYIKTADELGRYDTMRYSGNQIQPAKTTAVLKSRRWVADVEAGLQKIYYKENIVAEIYALADWFSPADIEAPTLEWVCFSDRKTGKAMKIDDIPDVIFSEVMRDVDLAVSVAHAGGVDPETSHSTIEMRAALISFILPMFRITNVRIDGRYAVIDGKLASYTVHLGSGVVHQSGGAMIPVLPVHSQHRGKIFLPFADEDPKTAEIVSKILLFAHDEKIKDPSILSCICK